MAKIMELFYGELGQFQTAMEDEKWEVDFRGEKYPPRITMDQLTPPACIQVIGTPDLRVITTGKLQISKKELNRYVNTAEKLLLLYLHGFMQEQKELEAEKG